MRACWRERRGGWKTWEARRNEVYVGGFAGGGVEGSHGACNGEAPVATLGDFERQQ